MHAQKERTVLAICLLLGSMLDTILTQLCGTPLVHRHMRFYGNSIDTYRNMTMKNCVQNCCVDEGEYI